ncbi:hypothetical protein JS82_05320 [Methanomassiliicoccaceae archaeon DOK]|nr:hypothetical protein JS82_05320 [Methanomassiliicoccaceae archaeon DOK]
MDAVTATSDTRPVELVTGPTMTLYRRDVTTSTEKDEKGNVQTIYTCRELRFPHGEYELVLAGTLPPGVDEWTADLRRIQRSALLDQADKLIAEANDNISYSDDQSVVDAWEAYRTQVRAYKMAVRKTVEAEGFPQQCTYPELPVQP